MVKLLVKTPLEWILWYDETVGVGGSTSPKVFTSRWERKTIYLISDQGGSLDVEVDPAGNGDWRTLASGLSVTADTLFSYQTTYYAMYMRVRFTPVAEATVRLYLCVDG